jgi:hypothetical protein
MQEGIQPLERSPSRVPRPLIRLQSRPLKNQAGGRTVRAEVVACSQAVNPASIQTGGRTRGNCGSLLDAVASLGTALTPPYTLRRC